MIFYSNGVFSLNSFIPSQTKRANPTISKSSRNMVDFGDRDYLERFEEFSSEAKKRLAIKKENAAKEISEVCVPVLFLGISFSRRVSSYSTANDTGDL